MCSLPFIVGKERRHQVMESNFKSLLQYLTVDILINDLEKTRPIIERNAGCNPILFLEELQPYLKKTIYSPYVLWM
jgi:hypothetical protein